MDMLACTVASGAHLQFMRWLKTAKVRAGGRIFRAGRDNPVTNTHKSTSLAMSLRREINILDLSYAGYTLNTTHGNLLLT